jgi:hypothetical protein
MAVMVEPRSGWHMGTTVDWEDPDAPILEDGQLGLDFTLAIIKTGDGHTRFPDLPE